VTSSNTPNTISKLGTISIVMQHFSGINPSSDANTAIASASASRKLQQATIENKLSLVNFAPCCTIRYGPLIFCFLFVYLLGLF
jgi:hypothetical protein